MAHSQNRYNYLVFHQDQLSPVTYMQQPQPNNNYNPQPSFNQNYMQQPMLNHEDITDPTTTMNMALVLMAKAFKLNYSTPTNNNQRISLNPRNRQIAQPGMNLGQDKQIQMVGGNGGNQFRQYAGQNNGIIVILRITNPNANQNGNGNVVVAWTKGIQLQAEEFKLMVVAGDLDEIEEANANCILMANLQQASTSGTQTDNAPVYDSDGSVEAKSREELYFSNTSKMASVSKSISVPNEDFSDDTTLSVAHKFLRVDITTKTRMPQTRSNTKNDRVPSASKSSCIKNKQVEVEKHHRNLLVFKNKKHMSSKCNNVKLAIQNDKSKVVCAMFLLQAPVIIVRTENGTKFKNQVLQEYFNIVGISHQASSVRTPQQNRFMERRNHTLVEAARTMFIFSCASLFLWDEAIATACYTKKHSIIHRRFDKTLYELINGRKPDISFLYVFGALCYPKKDQEDIRKVGAKGDTGFFIGYFANSCAYRGYNQMTKKIIKTKNMKFDELSVMAFEQRNSKLKHQSMTTKKISSGLDLTYASSTITTQQPTEHELDLLFEAMYDDYIGGQPSTATRTTLAAQVPQVLHTPTTSTTTADTASTPSNSFSRATNIPNTS
nr:hypothetical protein [Tanacetum cinerariifolium]